MNNIFIKLLLLFTALYFLLHIAAALANPVVINQPDGGQKVCIVNGQYITCY
jgi:hypothetical protein